MLQPINTMMRMRGPPPQRPPLTGPHMPGAHSHNNLPDMASDNMSGQKSSATMDSQYMQQQSQIFVFTTRLANNAADAVDGGAFASILDFHCSNPETKKLLDKYPLKPQPNRSSSVWLNSLAQRQGPRPIKGMHPSALKNSFGPPVRGQMANACIGSCNMHTPSGPGPGGGMTGPGNNWANHGNGNMCSNPNASPNWSAPPQPMFAQNFDDPNQKFNPAMAPNGAIVRPCGPFGPNNPQNNQTFNTSCPPGVGGPPQMAGGDIPDENLTPQQKQHREKQLAIIRKMQLQLCPEMMDSPPMTGAMMARMPAPNHPMTGPDFMMDPNNMCPMPESDHLAGSDPNVTNCMTPSTMMPTPNNMPVADWAKNNFLDERRRKSQACGQGGHNNMCSVSTPVPISHASPLSQPPSVLNSPSPCVSQSPGSRIPPPPYQGIRPHSSPHPSSPAAGSMPLPSPRTQSPAIGSVPQSSSRAQTPTTGSVGVQGSRTGSPSSGSVTQPSPSTQSPAIGSVTMPSPRAKSPNQGSLALPSPRTQSPADPSRQTIGTGSQSRVTHTSPSPMTPSADSNSNISGTTVHSPKPSTQSSHVCSTSSTAVQNNTRTQTTANMTNMKTTTPSNTLPLTPSPSNVKKVPNHIPPKGMGPECGSELMMSPMPIDQKPHPSEFGPMAGRPPMGHNCSSPFMCKPEPALMPVPSPQQIQYLNAFEGQELTIQKQPNISLRDADLISPTTDLDLGFSPEFGPNCQPFGNNFGPGVDNMNPRFASNPPNHNLNGNQFGPNSRFMSPEPNQRFGGPVFDGPRMPNPDNQFRAQNVCMPYGQPVDNNMMRFNGPCDTTMSPRLRPNDMVTRFPPNHPQHPHPHPDQFHPTAKSPMSGPIGDQMMSFNCFGQQIDSGVSSTHLQSLQKMTPPFDMGPNGAHPHSHNGSNGPMPPMQGMPPMAGLAPGQRSNFDPISSMAAMTEPNQNPNQPPNLMPMQVANGGPGGPPTMVNFHTNMASMQAMHQNMGPDSNGMQSPFPMSAQMNPQMSGGPQTVNNTYVNATMSIQQLNIQNMPNTNPNANFNPNMDQNSMHNLPVPGQGMGSPSAMQMMQQNSSAKMGPNFPPHMSGPQSGPNFHGQQMAGQRPMNPSFPGPNPHMVQRCYNSANIQIKPDAPNTIQYLPPRQQNPSMSARAPSLDFLQRCEPPLTNLGNKLPTHNLQYFPSNNSNMSSSPTMPLGPRMMAQNMPMGSGPGRPVNPQMVRTPDHNSGPMMAGPEMFGRPPGPNSMTMNGPPNAMFTMKPNADPVSPGGMGPEAAQPLPPSLSHSSFNYKQNSFNALSVPSDPNYAIQYQHFQQQLYATNTTRAANSSANNNAANGPRMSGQPNNFYSSAK